MPCVNLCHVESNASNLSVPYAFDPRDRGTDGAKLAPTLALINCIKDIQAEKGESTCVRKWGHYTYWLACKNLERPNAGSIRATRQSLRDRVTNRLLYEGEFAEKPEHRILALSKLLSDCTAQDAKEKDAPLDASTEDAVREELRNPSARLIELMIDEWCGGSPSSAEISLDADGNPPRPPISELVRRLLPHWEDVLRAEGWTKAEPCEP